MKATIDYVCPMVFPDDHEWQKVLEKASGRKYSGMKPIDTVRYRSWDNEELLIRCVRKFLPWVRDIHLIIAQESQRRPWMDDYGIKVVYHRDIIPSRFLPTFNSGVIEMYLHKIPGLSERFIYGNDDMFPLSPLEETEFFRDGLPCQHCTERPSPEHPNIFHRFCMHGLNMVAADHGMHFDKTWLRGGHGIAPFLKDVCIEIWKRHAKEIEASNTPFREACNLNQYIYGWEQHFSKRYVQHTPPGRYVGAERVTPEEMAEVIAKPGVGVVCINDNEGQKDIGRHAEAARKAIEEKLK